MSNQRTTASAHASTTGQAYTGAAWLDTHFEASRPEYEAMLRSVPFAAGWQVLDAGCGSGGFVPLLAEAVGPTGRIIALDLAPDNVAIVQRRVAEWGMATPIEAQVGTLVALPFPADSFDAVWCANATQYLTDAELRTALREFQRVTRPGGLVAIKDHAGAIRMDPTPPFYRERQAIESWRAASQPGFRLPDAYRGPTLRTWLLQAGYADVWARSTIIERWAPLRPVEQAFWRDGLRSSAERALGMPLPKEDLALCRELSAPGGAAAFVARPDFYCWEINVVAVGRVV